MHHLSSSPSISLPLPPLAEHYARQEGIALFLNSGLCKHKKVNGWVVGRLDAVLVLLDVRTDPIKSDIGEITILIGTNINFH